MIEWKPEIENLFVCPRCQSSQPVIHRIVIPSAHVMADCTCVKCGFDFYQTVPIGHTVSETLSINKSDGELYAPNGKASWLSQALLNAHRLTQQAEVPIKKIVFERREKVVILNALDHLYGHCLLKLYNSLYHLDHQPDLGLIVIIPASLEWLIPTGCAEAWVVDLPLSMFKYNHVSLQDFVTRECARFHTIYLSKGYSHPDFSAMDITRFIGIEPFDLATFTNQQPTITFILREDRWWYAGRIHYWFYRVCRKLNLLAWGSRWLARGQNRLVKKVIRAIRKKWPDANFYLAGLGKTGTFTDYAIDWRMNIVDSTSERDWCRIYARSHVVVGVHGSNMLLPTALAAGCVEILPRERYGNMIQDISVRYTDRRQLFFYRFADQFTAPKSVASKVISMIEDYDVFYRNMCCNVYAASPGGDRVSSLSSDADIYAVH